MDILDRILEAKRAELARAKAASPVRRLIERASAAPPPHDLPSALRKAGRVNVIAEVKRASPSRGEIQPRADPVATAREYAEAGAAAISVLTDARFFLGAPEHLSGVRAAVPLPVIRKDFLFDEYQVYESRALGADGLLLITRILDAKTLQMLIGVTRALHMEALVEVHSEEDLRKALDCGAAIIGVNNRDLGTMQVSLDTSLRLAPLLTPEVVRVSESGIETRADIDRLREAGYDAFLVGERLMREASPGRTLAELIAEESG
ncbi:MAG: indole-3-glycerol phosphate synthase TrpC [Acidobacteriota bacterium]